VSVPPEFTENNLFLQAKCLEIAALVLSDLRKKYGTTGEVSGKLQKAKNIIEKNYAQNLSIKNIARELGLNANKLMQEYRREFGTTIHNHMVSLKMANALNSIGVKGLTVGKAAEEAGYAHVGHFIKTFRHYYGFTPGEMKKRATT
jgi:AraC-like DNA-binding protein